ncbi:MAG: PD-(D/E)XK nuclease family transposase [Pirellula sp.]|jgi:predicted transposase/invertase (TIGR01784 family)|nr:Rpn family recombination-promoting nuclease/putative transposase [Pirellula sp.]
MAASRVMLIFGHHYKDFQDDKLICVDVKATDRAGRVFIVEVQIVVHPSFAKRAAYYACKGYSDQLQTGQGYLNAAGIKKTIVPAVTNSLQKPSARDKWSQATVQS